MKCPECQEPVQPDWKVCPYCQAVLSIKNEDANPFAQPMSPIEPTPIHAGSKDGQQDSTEALSGIIPYKNPKALIAYYTSIAGGLPIIGLPFSIAALILGIMGLKDRKRDPRIKGSVHAWIGIGCGGLFSLIWGTLVIFLIIAAVTGGFN